MALLDLGSCLCAERASLPRGMHHQLTAVRALPRNLQGHDRPPCPVNVHWHVPDGPGDYHQYDMFRLCTGLGGVGALLCLGTVDL